MKTDTFVKLLRKVVREEVQQVVREELGLMLEAPEPKKTVTETKTPVVKNSLVDSIKAVKPVEPAKPMAFTQNDVLNDILNETAHASDWRSLGNMDSSMAEGFGGGMGMIAEPVVVNSVDQMLANTRPAGDINSVRIDTVPDFSGLMATMKEKGQL